MSNLIIIQQNDYYIEESDDEYDEFFETKLHHNDVLNEDFVYVLEIVEKKQLL